MDYNFFQNLEYCRVIVDEFTSLLLYSHVPTAIIALLIGLFVFWKNKDSLLARILLAISIVFASWDILDLTIWMNYDKSSVVMATWAPIELLSILLFIFCLYFLYVFADNKDVSFMKKVTWGLLILPIIIVLPSTLNLENYDLQECIAWENSYYQDYYRALKIVFSSWIIFALIQKYIQANKDFRKQIIFLGLGMMVFLLSSFGAGYVSDITLDYRYEMYGLFAMVVFMASLAYLIVKFKTFNLKLFGAQILIVSLMILIGSQFAFIQDKTGRVLTAITLIITGFIGINLIRSVKKEIALREDLQVANDGQSNLIHIINHQIKGYLSKARNIFSELMTDPDYGPMPDQAKPMLDEGFKSLTEGVGFVKDFLDAANIEKGSYAYEMEPLDMKALVLDVADKQKAAAEEKGLSYEVNIAQGDYSLKGDKTQLGQAVRNLIDNSIRYTPKGGLVVSLSGANKKILFSVKDTGVGISNELRPKLFTKGGRDKDSLKVNINSTGYGLVFVKGVAEAHKGRVWAESAGPNLGSTFYMELPVVS